MMNTMLLDRFLAGQDPEAECWMRAGWRKFYESGSDDALDLLRFLGLPTSRRATLVSIRDHKLRAAMHYLDPDGTRTVYSRAKLLRQACQAFARRWPVWQRQYGTWPDSANYLERALFDAFDAAVAAGHLTPDELSLSSLRQIVGNAA